MNPMTESKVQADYRRELGEIVTAIEMKISNDPETLNQAVVRLAEIEALSRQARHILARMAGVKQI